MRVDISLTGNLVSGEISTIFQMYEIENQHDKYFCSIIRPKAFH